MGVSFVKFKGDDRVVTIARNAELPVVEDASAVDAPPADAAAEDVSADAVGTEDAPE
jgi:DNA gyrase subunit A